LFGSLLLFTCESLLKKQKPENTGFFVIINYK